MKPRMIVAEIASSSSDGGPLLSTRFENVIKKNTDNGYTLHSWQFGRVIVDDAAIYDKIIAVFELPQGDF